LDCEKNNNEKEYHMSRPKHHLAPYTGDKTKLESAFHEYLSCIVDCFGEPYDDRDDAGNCGRREYRTISLRTVCDEFSISIPKARKLLITAGVYSTEKSRTVAELYDQRKTVDEITVITELSRSSVSSYLPYQSIPYNMNEVSRHAEDSRKYRERKRAVDELHKKISLRVPEAELDTALWQCVIAFQNYPFHTSSGLPFLYTVKKNKNGEYSGELVISRKEDSKTLTKSSVMLAFHTVLEGMRKIDGVDDASSVDGRSPALVLPEYKGPKAIGQIFGISYVYSLFWKWNLIRVPEKVEMKLRGRKL